MIVQLIIFIYSNQNVGHLSENEEKNDDEDVSEADEEELEEGVE
ncbi:MAG: hypothetical protein WBE61_08505 [Nitrososphaeraceae archaeon]